jgi:Family of unknown function (DUF5681)
MKSRSKPTKPKPKPKAKPKRRDGDLTPSPAYTKERVAGLKPAWEPGQSGNPAGRPVGARTKLSEAFLQAFYETWEKHGVAALEWVAKNDQATFVRCAAAIIPKNLNIESSNVMWIVSDRPLTDEEWVAYCCGPDEYARLYPDGKLTPGEEPPELPGRRPLIESSTSGRKP